MTYIIANIDGSQRAFQETLSTLRFARRAKMIKNTVGTIEEMKPLRRLHSNSNFWWQAVVNQNMEEDVISLKQEITKLQQQLHSLRGRKLGGNGKLKLGPAGMIWLWQACTRSRIWNNMCYFIDEEMVSIRKLLKTALEKQQEGNVSSIHPMNVLHLCF